MSEDSSVDRNLALESVRVTEAAAIAAARFMGGGDEQSADQAAVEAMHRMLQRLEIDGTVRIGEGNEGEVGTLGDEMKKVFDKLGDHFKVVCVSPDLKDSVDEMAQSQRDHVVMVRVDEETRNKLDAWVEAGAVKSRSEAAALFIREGLKVRQAELEKLEESLSDLEKARQRVREKAREVFGDGNESEPTA